MSIVHKIVFLFLVSVIFMKPVAEFAIPVHAADIFCENGCGNNLPSYTEISDFDPSDEINGSDLFYRFKSNSEILNRRFSTSIYRNISVFRIWQPPE